MHFDAPQTVRTMPHHERRSGVNRGPHQAANAYRRLVAVVARFMRMQGHNDDVGFGARRRYLVEDLRSSSASTTKSTTVRSPRLMVAPTSVSVSPPLLSHGGVLQRVERRRIDRDVDGVAEAH